MINTDCDAIDLIAYLEGETDDETRRHLEACAACRERLARYQRLTQAMIQSRRVASISCPQRERTVAAAAGESETDRLHLDHCPACRELTADIAHVLADIDKKAPVSTASLPDGVLRMVAQRKATWQAERFKKVLDFQGVKNGRKQDRMTQAFFDSADDALPKAAFPDDLAGDRHSDDEEPEPSD